MKRSRYQCRAALDVLCVSCRLVECLQGSEWVNDGMGWVVATYTTGSGEIELSTDLNVLFLAS